MRPDKGRFGLGVENFSEEVRILMRLQGRKETA